KVRASGADLVYLGGVIETGAQVIIRQMKEVGLTAPRTRFMGPDGLLEEELLKGATCDAALATDMRVTFAGLPFEKMRGVGAKTYETYKAKFGKEPTSYALYAAEGTRVIIDAIKRSAPAIEKAKDVTEKREAVRKAIASTKNFEGINGKWSFDENGDVDYDTMSGFKAVKADGPVVMLGLFISLAWFTLLGVTGTLTGWQLLTILPLVFVLTMLTTATLNVAIDRVAYRPLRRSTRLAPLITAIGVSFMLENVALLWKGPAPIAYPDVFPSVDILREWFGVDSAIFVTTKDVLVVGATIPL